MKRLRDPEDGCPWDREQTFGTIAPYTLEEAYEVADAIDRDDLGALRDELGDLLFQVVFHAQMADEAGVFDFADVVEAISTKMIRRHPHVFGDAAVGSADEQRQAWESHKRSERGANPVLGDVAHNLPALKRAAKLGKRAASVGFDWPDAAGARAKLEEELAELDAAAATQDAAAVAEELGDLLFAATNVARHWRIDPEEALRQANAKFARRFEHVEAAVARAGRDWDDFTLAELESFWQAAKQSG